MNSNSIIKFLKYTEIAIVAIVVVICGYVAIFGGNSGSRIIAIGSAVGAIIGSVIDIKIIMPREYKDKDERTIIIKLLSQLFSVSLGLLVVVTVFSLAIFDAIAVFGLKGFIIFIVTLGILMFGSEKVVYKALNKRV